MAELRLVSNKARLCLVGNGVNPAQKALFHRWVDQAYTVRPSNLVGGSPGGQVWGVFGLVELENGEVNLVPPCNIKFLDSPHEEYAWPDTQDSK